MRRLTRLDRGTDVVAIRMRRSVVVLPGLAGLAAAQVDVAPVSVLVSIAGVVWTLYVFVWLLLRPWRSPLVAIARWPDATRHRPGRARRARGRLLYSRHG